MFQIISAAAAVAGVAELTVRKTVAVTTHTQHTFKQASVFWRRLVQESPADARVTRDSAVIPTWPSVVILDIIEPEIVPCDPLTPKTLA